MRDQTAKRLAVLICDTPNAKVQELHGDYTTIYPNFLKASLPPTSGLLDANGVVIDCYDVVHAMIYPDDGKVEEYDGIVITGSAASAYDDLVWINKLIAFVERVARTHPQVRLIGICFGHQIVGRALGGTCVSNDGKWELGPTSIDLTPLGKKIFGQDTINIQEVHRDHVPAVPPQCHLLGSTSACYNQGMVRFYDSPSPPSSASSALPSSSPPLDFKLSDIHIFTVQGHPEFTESIVNAIVEVRRYSGVISDELAEDVNKRRYWRNDGVSVIGKAIWGVLGVETRDGNKA